MPPSCRGTPRPSGRVTPTLSDPKKPEGYHCLEIYILSKELLLRLVDECDAEDKVSFRRDVLSSMGDKFDIRGYVFGGRAAQIRTVKEYYDRSMDMLNRDLHQELFAAIRPVRAKEDDEAPTYIAPESTCVNSMIADGCVIEGTVENSLLFPGVTVAKGAVVKNSILFKRASIGAGASVSHIIADKNVTIREGVELTGTENYPMVVAKNSVV